MKDIRCLSLEISSTPEVQGLIGFAGGDAVVINDVDQLPELKKKVGIIVQTTQSFDTFQKIVLQVINTAREVKIL